ncbi:MAG: polyphosphate kinase 2 [Alphaproteobacteria bacterium]
MDEIIDIADLKISRKDYKARLHDLQVELVKLQRHIIAEDEKVLIIVEGRDAGGKDGAIKRITEHLSPRETRVVALGKPSDRDKTSWYFQRWAAHLPAAGELVLFNRSWYNRAGVERVMGFCTDAELQEFFETVVFFEQMLIRSGIKLFKYYLDISCEEQRERMQARRDDPLKQWKISPVDEVANKKWDEYSAARNEMFARTHNPMSPWRIARADNKRLTRINVIADLLSQLDYQDKDHGLAQANPALVFSYDPAYVDSGAIAP